MVVDEQVMIVFERPVVLLWPGGSCINSNYALIMQCVKYSLHLFVMSDVGDEIYVNIFFTACILIET